MGQFNAYLRSGSHTDKRTATSIWLGQHTNPVRAGYREAIKAAGGIRQFKRQRRASRIA